MRTTLDIDADVLFATKSIAKRQGTSMDKVISALVRQALSQRIETATRMDKEKMPRLTEAKVRKLASGQSFERGQRYFHDEAIVEPQRQGMELRARCEGSAYEPYEVHVMFDAQGVADASCTCPYDWGGACKHIVALLLTYTHNPQAFRVIAPLETLLAECSREQLLALIGGIDLAPGAYEAVLEHANEVEWAWIEARLRAEIPQQQDRAREALVEIPVSRGCPDHR